MRSKKGSRKIVVDEIEYRWRAKGDDGYISVGIWPANDLGPYIQGSFKYHETWVDNGNRSKISNGDQILITNKIIRRIIDYVIANHDYSPLHKGKVINLQVLDGIIEWDDAERAVPCSTY